MIAKIGYLYHLHDCFYSRFNNCNLSYNKSNSRPVCFAVGDKNINNLYWAVPLSSDVPKYKAIYEKSISKYKKCDTLVIAKYAGEESVFLIQNLFPVTEKYISHVHTISGIEIPLINTLKNTISKKVNRVLELKNCGIKCYLTDIDLILNQLLMELLNNNLS